MVHIDSKRQRPIELVSHERLLLRLPPTHEKYKLISDKVYRLGAGYSGELDVDRILPEIGLPKNCFILKDIRLEVIPNFHIQLDTLIITRHCIILLEIKKYSGTTQFDEAVGKTIRISPNGEVGKYDCAVDQVDRAVEGLQRILKDFPTVPKIIPIIVMANAATDILKYPRDIPVKYKKQLPRYIRQLLKHETVMTEQECLKINNHIQSSAKKLKKTPLCERYEIPVADIQKGVICPSCNGRMKKSQGRSWTCEICQTSHQLAAKQAVEDWFMLISPTITNRELCAYLDINRKSATRVLGQLKLTKIGQTKRTHYIQ